QITAGRRLSPVRLTARQLDSGLAAPGVAGFRQVKRRYRAAARRRSGDFPGRPDGDDRRGACWLRYSGLHPYLSPGVASHPLYTILDTQFWTAPNWTT